MECQYLIASVPTRLTPKQEKFALAYVEKGNASAAYRQAYDVGPNTKPETVNRKAKEQLDHGKIAARIEELQGEHLMRHNITVSSLTKELEEARLKAMKDPKGANAAVAATMGKAKLHGLLKERVEHSGNTGLAQILAEIDGDTKGLDNSHTPTSGDLH